MAILVLGLIIFLGLHSTRIFAEGGREKAIARLGEGPWKGIYSLLSVVGFVLIVWGFAEARASIDKQLQNIHRTPILTIAGSRSVSPGESLPQRNDLFLR